MREFKHDSAFRRCVVLKTPFRGDVARVYFRNDNRIVVQHGGVFRPIFIPNETPVSTALSLASDALDNWETSTH